MALLLISIVMASQDFVIPDTRGQWSQMATTLLVVFSALCVFAIGAAFLSRRIGSIPVLGQMTLVPPVERTEESIDKVSGKPVLVDHPDVSVGDWGVAESLLRPAGRVRFNDQSLDVVSDGSYIASGSQVRVTEISGNRIVVSEIENSEETVWKSEV